MEFDCTLCKVLEIGLRSLIFSNNSKAGNIELDDHYFSHYFETNVWIECNGKHQRSPRKDQEKLKNSIGIRDNKL